MKKLLLVDDETNVLRALERLLRQDGYEIFTAESGQAALDVLAKEPIQVIISDQRMPYMTGSEFLSMANKLYPQTIRIILSGFADFGAVTEAINQGAIYKFLTKPWDNAALRQHVAEAFERYELSLKKSQSLSVFENALEAVVMTDEDDMIQFFNPEFTKMTGYGKNYLNKEITALFDPSKHPENFFMELKLALEIQNEWHGEVWQLHKDGFSYPTWMSVKVLHEEAGTQYTYFFIDITKQKHYEQQISEQMYEDGLTNLKNQLGFTEKLSRMIDMREKEKYQAAVLLLEIDRFETIQPALGIEACNELLQKVAERLVAWEKDASKVGHVGDKEFAVIHEDVKKYPKVESLIQELVKQFEEPFNVADKDIHLTVSVGCSIYPSHGNKANILLNRAYLALQQARLREGNSYRLYQEDMETISEVELNLSNDLHRAVEKQELVVYYQPIVDTATKKIAVLEALIRWQHPLFGLVYPDQFISLAESSGLIVPMGYWVLDSVCQQIKAWQTAGYPVKVAVNISAKQLEQNDFCEKLTKILAKHALSPQVLELEVTESLVMKDIAGATVALQAISKLGIPLVIDDFGTGYSSLGYLQQFPFNKLKIDKIFINQILASDQENLLAAAIIALAKSLGLQIVAEGVENETQFAYLKAKGCECIQGYWISKPVPPQEIEQLFSSLGV